MPSTKGTGHDNRLLRRPTESGGLLVGAIGALVIKFAGLDDDIAWTVPIIVGAIPTGITIVADWLVDNFGKKEQP